MSNFDPFDDETAVAPPELQDEMKKRGQAHLVNRDAPQGHHANRTPSIANEPPIAPHRNHAPLRLDEENFDPPSTKRMVPLGKGGNFADSPDEYTVEEKSPLGNADLERIADRIRLASTPPSDPDRGFLTVTVGSDKGRRIGLPEGRTTIGRSTDNDIVLTDISVSRKHITVERRDKIYYICDIGSGNGTIVNGRKRVGEIIIVNGDSFCIGNTEIGFEGPEARLSDSLPTNTWDQPQGKSSLPPENLQDSEDEPTVMGKGPSKRRHPPRMAEVAYEEPTNVVPSVEVSPDAHLAESKIQEGIAPTYLNEGPSDNDAQAAAIDAIESIIATPEPEILSMHTILPDEGIDARAQSEPAVYSSAPPSVPAPNPAKKKPAPTIMGPPMPALPKANPAPVAPSFRGAPAPLVTGAPSHPAQVEAGQWPSPNQSSNPPGQNAPNPAMGRPQMAPQGMAPQGMAPQGMAPQGMAPQGMAPQGMAPQGMAPQPFQGGPMATPMQGSGSMPVAQNTGTVPSYESLSSPMGAAGHTDQLRGRYAAKPKNKSSKGLIALICLALVLVAGGIIAAVNGQATETDEVASGGDDTTSIDASVSADNVKDKNVANNDVKDKNVGSKESPTTGPAVSPPTDPTTDSDAAAPTKIADKQVEDAEQTNIGSLIAQNTTLPASTWGNDESFITDIGVPSLPDNNPKVEDKPPVKPVVPKVTKRIVKNPITRKPPKRRDPPKRDDPPKTRGKTSAIKAAARGLYKQERYADAADKLENAADDFDGDEADDLFAIADKYRAIGKLLNNVENSNPTSGLSALKKAQKKDRSVGGALSKLIRARIGKIAPKAASAYMAKKNYSKARSAADDAKRENAGAAVERIYTSLERKAASNIKKAKRAQKNGDRDEAKTLLQEAIKMTPKGSDTGNDARDMLRKL